MNPDTERKMVLKQKPISPIDRLQHIIICKKVILKDTAELEALEMAIEKLKEKK